MMQVLQVVRCENVYITLQVAGFARCTRYDVFFKRFFFSRFHLYKRYLLHYILGDFLMYIFSVAALWWTLYILYYIYYILSGCFMMDTIYTIFSVAALWWTLYTRNVNLQNIKFLHYWVKLISFCMLMDSECNVC